MPSEPPPSGRIALVVGEAEPLPPAYDVLGRQARLVGVPDPEALERTAAELGAARLCVIAVGAGAEAALRLAAGRPELVERLVLVSPPELGGGAAAPGPPVLVVRGTADAAAGNPGRAAAERPPGSSYALVYDAGPDVASDRPEAFAAVVGDFLEWADGFAVSHVSQALNP